MPSKRADRPEESPWPDDGEEETRELTQASALLGEWLALRDSGARVDRQEWLARAAQDRGRLEEHLDMVDKLEELAATIAYDPEAESGPREVTPREDSGLGRFSDLRLLGRGGSGAVYIAQDERLGREVALKVLHAAYPFGEDTRHWLESEGRSLAKLTHPSIVQVFEVDEVDGQAYIAMERLRGVDLHRILQSMRAGDQPPAEQEQDDSARRAGEALAPLAARCRLALQIARALAYCHSKGVVHRDMKPANVIVGEDLHPKLIDFGLAHQRDESIGITVRLHGTPGYIAPEQVDSARTGASEASDQFSLGVLMYELFTLHHPFALDSRAATMTAISRAAPVPLRSHVSSIPLDVERICLHALERRPEDRYASLTELADDLENFLAYRAISLRAPSPWKRTRLWVARNRLQVLATAVTFATVATFWGATQVTAIRRERAELVQSIDELRGPLRSATRGDAFVPIFAGIITLDERARRFDAAFLRPLVAPPVTPEVARLTDDTSRQLAEALEAQTNRLLSEGGLTVGARGSQGALLFEAFRAALGLDQMVAPDSPYTREVRKLGTASLPVPRPGQRARLSRFRAGEWMSPDELCLEPLGADVGPGKYRLEFLGSGDELCYQRDFLVLPWAEQRVIDLPAPLGVDLGEWVRFRDEARPHYDSNEPPSEPGTALDEFWIMQRPVDWTMVVQVLGDQPMTFQRATVGRPLGMSEPAVLRGDQVREFAARVGARLPTATELLAALDSGRISRDDSDVIDMEWSSSINTLDDQLVVRYERDSEQRSGAVNFLREHGVNVRAGFRLALSYPAALVRMSPSSSEPGSTHGTAVDAATTRDKKEN